MWAWTQTVESVVFMVFGFVWGIIVTIPALHWWAARKVIRRRKAEAETPAQSPESVI